MGSYGFSLLATTGMSVCKWILMFLTSMIFILKPRITNLNLLKNFQKLLPDLYSKLENVKDRVSLDLFFKYFVDSVSECAYKSYRKKGKGRLPRKFSFWNPELRALRNKVTALYKKYDILRKTVVDGLEVQAAGSFYRNERAIFKRRLLYFRTLPWRNFCIQHNEKFGAIFRFVFKKSRKVNNLDVRVDNVSNPPLELRVKTLLDNFFPNNDNFEANFYVPNNDSLDPLVEEDLTIVFNGLKSGKAPGLDRLEYKMWNAIYDVDKSLLLNIFNTCFLDILISL
ncbi:hypothetical protein AVEN_199967-1 [Araneus ventricosus]|uniref:Reverse transcriptase domain-containing protein n=1 Tax=Araneus ventricosus TaxID=182803 RepID=A0A4Y2BXX8_ARAVE|nr:hypothetical protein AVEN_199967-1 [Araneus ventricosus]